MEKDNFNDEEMSTKRHLQTLVWEGLFNSLDNKDEKKSKKGKQKSDKESGEGKKPNESDKESGKKA